MTGDLFEPADNNRPGPVFDAQYGSDCSEGDEIQAGDSIRADGYGGFAHVSCLRMGVAAGGVGMTEDEKYEQLKQSIGWHMTGYDVAFSAALVVVIALLAARL